MIMCSACGLGEWFTLNRIVKLDRLFNFILFTVIAETITQWNIYYPASMAEDNTVLQ